MKERTSAPRNARQASAVRVAVRPARGKTRPRGRAAAATLALGAVARVDDKGTWVDYPGNRRGPALARLMAPVGAVAGPAPLKAGQAVVLLVDAGGVDVVVMGLLQPLAPGPSPSASGQPIRLEGQRLEIQAGDELVLRCGEASVTLRRNGRAVIRGAYVETHAKGVNRIKGGSVSIN